MEQHRRRLRRNNKMGSLVRRPRYGEIERELRIEHPSTIRRTHPAFVLEGGEPNLRIGGISGVDRDDLLLKDGLGRSWMRSISANKSDPQAVEDEWCCAIDTSKRHNRNRSPSACSRSVVIR